MKRIDLGNCALEAKSAFLKAFPCFNKLLSNLYQMTWYAHIPAALFDPSATVRYIGRYTKRAVLAEYRITRYDGQAVRFAFRDYAEGGTTSYKTMPVLAFIGRLIRHVPDKHFKMVRYAGIFAPRWKARYLEQARAALAQGNKAATKLAAKVEPTQASLLPWRQRRLAEKHKDPLVCPFCHVEMELMEVVFGSHVAIARYFERAQRAMAPFHPAWQPAPG